METRMFFFSLFAPLSCFAFLRASASIKQDSHEHQAERQQHKDD